MDNNLGSRIKEAREKSGLSQGELAKRLGIAYPTLSKYEQGHRIPDAELLNRMTKELNVDPGWFLSGEGKMRELEVYDLASATMNIEGEQTYMTNQGPMAFSEICSSMGVSPNDFDSWLRNHHKNLREKYRNIERLIEVLEEKKNDTNLLANIVSSEKDTLKNLIEKLEQIYAIGEDTEKAIVRGIIEHIHDKVLRLNILKTIEDAKKKEMKLKR